MSVTAVDSREYRFPFEISCASEAPADFVLPGPAEETIAGLFLPLSIVIFRGTDQLGLRGTLETQGTPVAPQKRHAAPPTRDSSGLSATLWAPTPGSSIWTAWWPTRLV